MLELPESRTVAAQMNQTLPGRRIQNVTAAHTPHKLVWYFGDPEGYHALLAGKEVGEARALGGNVELCAEDVRILFQDGGSPRLLSPGEPLPNRHQLWIEFEDGFSLVATVQMYGGLLAYREGENENPYYLAARDALSPYSGAFDEAYFASLCSGCDKFAKLSAKAFLATEQRIPGLGNGVLQDILWNARIHPKTKMGTLTDAQLAGMFQSLKQTLLEIWLKGGRQSERDLFGCPGGYTGVLNKNTAKTPCPVCGEEIRKEAYLGGSVYYCPSCQPYEGKKKA